MATITKFPCKSNCSCSDCRSKCDCCLNNRIFNRNLCLWCEKDKRKVALFNLCHHFCNWFASPIRFCKTCLKAIASEDDIKEWIVNDWDPGTYMSPDGYHYDDVEDGYDEFIAHYHEETFEALNSCLCECCEWSEGYWDNTEHYYMNTLSLDDVKKIETIRTKNKEKELAKQLAKELDK